MTPFPFLTERLRKRQGRWLRGYLDAKLAEVRALQKGYESLGGRGISGSALIALGEATRVYEDMTSPSHGFDSIYSIPTKTITDRYGILRVVIDLDEWKKQLDEHSAEEDRDPTPEERQATLDRSRAFFLLAFGEKKFRQLRMSEEERQRAQRLAEEANQQ